MEELKLEVGKKYVNRDGDIVEIVSKDEGEPWPYVDSNNDTYEENGLWCDSLTHCKNLIEEYFEQTNTKLHLEVKSMEELKLEVGKSYVNRKGDIIKIICLDFNYDSYPFRGDDYQLYTYCGNYYVDGEFTDYDLVEEYIEPTNNKSSTKQNTSYTIDGVTMNIKKDGNKVKLKYGEGYSFSGETAAVLTDTGNGYICKFKAHNCVTQDYYVCLDYSHAQDLYFMLKTALGETITEGENNE